MRPKHNLLVKIFLWMIMLICIVIFGPFGLIMAFLAAFEIHAKVKVDQ